MLTPHLETVFRPYLAAVAFSHQIEIENKLRAASARLFVDIFVHLPALNTWVLCWSAAASNTTNRVFISDSHVAFRATQESGRKIRHMKHSSFSKDNTHEHDIALIARHHEQDIVAFVPISDIEGNCFATVRLIGREADLKFFGFSRDLPGYDFNLQSFHNLEIPDTDLLPHVLGRWAGSSFEQRGSKKTIEALLACFSSFFSTSRNMYFRRDFDDDKLFFHSSTFSDTQKLLESLKASIHDCSYMFSIVADRGAAEIVDDFPEDLSKDLRLNNNEWRPDAYYIKIKQQLRADLVSYIGIPLKVDDTVIGVFQLHTRRGEERFDEAARFMRSTLSEMGRTTDKKAMTRSSAIVRKLSSPGTTPKRFDQAIPNLSKKLVEELVRQIVSYGKLSVDSLEARLGGKLETAKGLSPSVSNYLQNSLVDIVLAGAVTLFIASERNGIEPPRGVIVVPITAALPFIIYIYGPVALLTGRTLRTALEHVQATFNLALAATEVSANSSEEMANRRGHLKLWATIHDLKNRTATFATPLRNLVTISANGDHADLKNEVMEFKETFMRVLEHFELECNDILRGTYFRTISEQQIGNLLAQAVQVVVQFPDYRGRVQFVTNTPLMLKSLVKTYTQELEMVFKELIRNILQHFERVGKMGQVIIDVQQLNDSRLQIRLSDTIAAGDDIRKVLRLLDDETSHSSLKRQLKPTIEKLLQGEIIAEHDLEHHSVAMIIKIPKEIIPH